MSTHDYSPVEAVLSWTDRRGVSGWDTVTGWQIAPGLAVVHLEGLEFTTRHWAVIHLGSGSTLVTNDLCEQCAYTAARGLAQVPGWNRPDDALTDDPAVTAAVIAAERFGPCYPPAGLEERVGMRMAVVGHTPGQPFRPPQGLPAHTGMLIPKEMEGQEITPEMLEVVKGMIREKAERDTGRRWFEQGD